MSTTIRTEPPRGGTWEWRELLPRTEAEYDSIVHRAVSETIGVHPGRFLAWVRSEMSDGEPVVSSDAASRYRRVLLELAQSAPPPKGRRRARGDRGLADLRIALYMAAGSSAALSGVRSPATALAVATVAVLDVTGTVGDDAGEGLKAAA